MGDSSYLGGVCALAALVLAESVSRQMVSAGLTRNGIVGLACCATADKDLSREGLPWCGSSREGGADLQVRLIGIGFVKEAACRVPGWYSNLPTCGNYVLIWASLGGYEI